jgi:hypothetical protein
VKTNIQVTFADGGTAIVAFRRQSPARIGIILRAWALLYRRDVRSWERTALPAEYWYDGQKRRMCRYGDPICHDLLEMVIPLAVAFQRRQREVVALRKTALRCKFLNAGGHIAKKVRLILGCKLQMWTRIVVP